jgi:hypothetical protein
MEHFYLYLIIWYLIGLALTSYMLYDDHIKGYDIIVKQFLIAALLSILGPIQLLIILLVLIVENFNINSFLDRTVIKGKPDD